MITDPRCRAPRGPRQPRRCRPLWPVALAVSLAGLPLAGQGGDSLVGEERSAQAETPLEQISPPVGELAEVAAAARARRFSDAARKGAKVWRQALDAGEPSPVFLGQTLAYLALADAARGQEAQAACRWQAAQTLEPRLVYADLDPFGAPGALLERHRSGLAGPFEIKSVGKGVSRPQVVTRVRPRFPLALKRRWAAGKVVVGAILDETGAPRKARVLESSGQQGFDVAAVDAICQWRFKPATREGRPVPVYLALTTHFNFHGGMAVDRSDASLTGVRRPARRPAP